MYHVLPLNFTHCNFKFIFNLGSDCSVLYNMTKNNMSPAREEEDNTSIKHNYNKTAAITADVF